MAVFDDFKENYETLLYVAYESSRDYPVMVHRRKAADGVFPRNGVALGKLREIERKLGRLNNEIL